MEQAAGNVSNSVRQVDHSAALDALRKLESRLRAAEDEVSEFKLKVRTWSEWLSHCMCSTLPMTSSVVVVACCGVDVGLTSG